MNLSHIKELDGLRGIAILLIIVWHYFVSLVPRELMGEDLWNQLAITWSGVDLFFVLSGFLIGRILLFNKDSKNYFKTFYIRRSLRILPLYYLVFGLFALLYWL